MEYLELLPGRPELRIHDDQERGRGREAGPAGPPDGAARPARHPPRDGGDGGRGLRGYPLENPRPKPGWRRHAGQRLGEDPERLASVAEPRRTDRAIRRQVRLELSQRVSLEGADGVEVRLLEPR